MLMVCITPCSTAYSSLTEKQTSISTSLSTFEKLEKKKSMGRLELAAIQFMLIKNSK